MTHPHRHSHEHRHSDTQTAIHTEIETHTHTQACTFTTATHGTACLSSAVQAPLSFSRCTRHSVRDGAQWDQIFHRGGTALRKAHQTLKLKWKKKKKVSKVYHRAPSFFLRASACWARTERGGIFSGRATSAPIYRATEAGSVVKIFSLIWSVHVYWLYFLAFQNLKFIFNFLQGSIQKNRKFLITMSEISKNKAIGHVWRKFWIPPKMREWNIFLPKKIHRGWRKFWITRI